MNVASLTVPAVTHASDASALAKKISIGSVTWESVEM